MPNVLRVNGFRFVIYQGSREHLPPHVHVFKAGEQIVINIEMVAVRTNKGMTRSNARAALGFVEDHQGKLMKDWRRING